MSTAQKIIKKLAIAFALFLIIMIFSMVVSAGVAIISELSLDDDIVVSEKKISSDEIKNMDISLKYASLKIKTGNKLKVSTTSKYVTVLSDDGVLKITDKNDRQLFKHEKKNVILYLPVDMKLDNVNIETGAGRVNIDSIVTGGLNLNLGVGKTVINNINVEYANIVTGTGDVLIKDGNLNNTSVEMGIGKLEIGAKFTGNNKIEAGVGEMKLRLSGDDYKIKFTKGLGSIYYNDNLVSNDTVIGDGVNYIEIDGGIGAINVNTQRS